MPGVPAFAAAAARLGTELTLPEVSQTIILTRTPGKASPMPDSERLEVLGQSRATLAIHLSVRNLGHVEEALVPHYGADCPVVVVYRATWPDEEIIRTTLGDMRARVRAEKITRTALVFVGPVFGEARFRDSRLYDADFAHVLRNAAEEAPQRGRRIVLFIAASVTPAASIYPELQRRERAPTVGTSCASAAPAARSSPRRAAALGGLELGPRSARRPSSW